MVYVAKGGSWLIAGYGLQLVMGIILATSFANLLSKESYGAYQFIISMASIVGVFTLTGIGTAIGRAVAQGETGALRYGAKISLKWSISILVVGAILAVYYFLRGNSTLAIAFAVVGLLQPLITASNLYKPYLQGRQLFREGVIIENSQRILPFLALLVALIITRNPLALAIVYFASQALSSSLAYLFVVRKHRLESTPNNELVSYSKHLSVMASFGEISGTADKVLVWVFLGAAPTAAYGLALLPIIHLQAIFGFLHQLAFPKLAKKSLDELKKVLSEKIRIYWFMALLVVGVYILIAPTLFFIFFPKYPESVIFSQILALSILAVPRAFIEQTFTAHKMTKELYIVSITKPFIRILLLAIGLWLFGIWGIIGAILLSEWYAAILQWVLFKRIDKYI